MKLRTAFTLIELLVVIAIIGILSGLIVVAMGGMTDKATIAKAQVFSNSLRNSLMMSIVGEWKFDELSTAVDNTVIQDSWGGINNGTLDTNYSATDTANKLKTGTDCVSGKCIQLDGVDDYIDCGGGTSLKNLTAKSILMWVKQTSYTGSAEYLFSQGWWNSPYGDMSYGTNGSYIIYLRNSLGNGVQSVAFTLPINTWTLVGYSWNGTTVTYYKNGLVFDNDAFSGTLSGAGRNLWLGGPGQDFSGIIDDVRIYNAAIPTSQIKEQYYSGLNSLFINGGISVKDYLSRLNNYASVY